MTTTSLSLLNRARDCDPHAWERMAELYTPLMRGWLRTYEVPGADADDLMQEVLAAVAKELPAFQHNERAGAFRNWLRTTLVHRLQQYWRAREHRPQAKGGSSLLEQLNQLQDESSQPSRLWNEQHDRDVIARLVEIVKPRFQPKTWDAFWRQMMEGQKPEQVAAELAMGLGSVYMARNRVLTALRTEAAGLVDTL